MNTLVARRDGKLSLRYAGRFQITERIRKVAYRLTLPKNAPIHDMFLVGVLKMFHGATPSSKPTLLAMENRCLLPTPELVLHASVRGESSMS